MTSSIYSCINSSSPEISNVNEFENTYVKYVYNIIADDFNRTRYSYWDYVHKASQHNVSLRVGKRARRFSHTLDHADPLKT